MNIEVFEYIIKSFYLLNVNINVYRESVNLFSIKYITKYTTEKGILCFFLSLKWNK